MYWYMPVQYKCIPGQWIEICLWIDAFQHSPRAQPSQGAYILLRRAVHKGSRFIRLARRFDPNGPDDPVGVQMESDYDNE